MSHRKIFREKKNSAKDGALNYNFSLLDLQCDLAVFHRKKLFEILENFRIFFSKFHVQTETGSTQFIFNSPLSIRLISIFGWFILKYGWIILKYQVVLAISQPIRTIFDAQVWVLNLLESKFSYSSRIKRLLRIPCLRIVKDTTLKMPRWTVYIRFLI